MAYRPKPECHVRAARREEFGLPDTTSTLRILNPKTLWQLCMCRSDEARRLILGVSERIENDEVQNS